MLNICKSMNNLLCFGLMVLIVPFVSASDYSALSDSEINDRLNYLDGSFKDIRDPYTYWQHGWTAIYAGSGAVQLYKAFDEDNSDDQTKAWVGAVKSVGGLTKQMLKPVPLVYGMSDYNTMPSESRDDKLARLVKAEKMLQHTAWRADERYTFKPHAMTVGVNVLGALAIVAFGDSSDAFASAALGIAVGEAAIWTEPVVAKDKWSDYNGRFNGGETSSVSWHIVPKFNGAELLVKF